MTRRKRTSRRSSPTQDHPSKESWPDRGERLQKVLAAAGFGSRRECEAMIVDGRVEVDGQIADELGVRVDPFRQRIRVDGAMVRHPNPVYYLVNKPAGVVCTNKDPSGRMRVVDLIRTDERVFPVGRLDRSSEGAILVTNDGELANRLTHPSFGIRKLYRVRVAGNPTVEILEKLRRGIHLADGFARVVGARVKRRFRQSTELEVTLTEGRNREIRRLFARVGHKVLRLDRIAMGPLRIGELPVGAYRRLTDKEVQQLKYATRRRTSHAAALPEGQSTRSTGTQRAPSGEGGRTATRPPKKKRSPRGDPSATTFARKKKQGAATANAPKRSSVKRSSPSDSSRSDSSPSRPTKKRPTKKVAKRATKKGTKRVTNKATKKVAAARTRSAKKAMPTKTKSARSRKRSR